MILFILNSSAGNDECDAVKALIDKRLTARGIEARVVLARTGAEMEWAAKEGIAAGADAVVAGGGDGTISTVAGVLADSGMPLGVLPLGTLNHFAKDLRIPLKPADALDVILAGTTMPVDVGEVNGKLFLNNSSLGLYARIVRLRERYEARGLAKWGVAAWAMLKVMEQNPVFTVRIGANGETSSYRSSLVMVGNNSYRMKGLDAGPRQPRGGALAVYVVKPESWHSRDWCGRSSRDAPRKARARGVPCPGVTIETEGSSGPVTRDGEVEQMECRSSTASRRAQSRCWWGSEGEGEG
jgi:diacylglycerol kinase family enzyme